MYMLYTQECWMFCRVGATHADEPPIHTYIYVCIYIYVSIYIYV